MQYETILVEREGRIAKLILNRPEKLNALNDRMESELQDAIQALNDDDGIGVVVLLHTAQRHQRSEFCIVRHQ